MSKEIQIFKNDEFGQVRALEINGEPYFAGKDVAEVLGYLETNAMTKRLDTDEFISDKLEGMNMKSVLINESGLYSLILSSKSKIGFCYSRTKMSNSKWRISGSSRS